MSNKSSDLLFLTAKAAIMAAKHEERVVTALKSLSSDGLILPEKDRENLEAFIEEFFGNSDDDTGFLIFDFDSWFILQVVGKCRCSLLELIYVQT